LQVAARLVVAAKNREVLRLVSLVWAELTAVRGQ